MGGGIQGLLYVQSQQSTQPHSRESSVEFKHMCLSWCIIDDLFRRCNLFVVNVYDRGCDLKCIERQVLLVSPIFDSDFFPPFPPPAPHPPSVNIACINT